MSQEERAALRPWDKHPIRIGVMNDFPGVAGDLAEDWVCAIDLAFREAKEARWIDRDVELVRRDTYGHPWNGGHVVVDAYRDLVENEKVLGVIGPMKTDDSVSLVDVIGELKVPLISMCGSQLMAGPEIFVLNQGSLSDEGPFMLEWIVEQGFRTCAVLFDQNQIGYEFLSFFTDGLMVHDVTVTAQSSAPVLGSVDDLVRALGPCKDSRPDCLVYLSLGMNNTRINRALQALDWDPQRVMTSAFVTAAMGKRWARDMDGWFGIDQFHEGNRHYTALQDRFEKVFGRRPANAMFPCGYDMGATMAMGLSMMRYHMPKALTQALCRVRRLPAAAGSPGTYISLGPDEHRGYRGEYLVMRVARDGRSELAPRS